MNKIGIIGGSGLEKLQLFTEVKELNISTLYGDPSSSIFSGHLHGKEVYILSRHGRNHEIPPSYVNNLANIAAFRELGVDTILATTACGSLREHIHPGELILPDQFIDFTRQRKLSFFQDLAPDTLMHTAMPDPFDLKLRDILISVAASLELHLHTKGTVVTIEGPRFSTRAESRMFRVWGADIINMSSAPECMLANEAAIPYAAIAMCTDYDAWREGDPAVSWPEMLEIFHANAEKVTHYLEKILEVV